MGIKTWNTTALTGGTTSALDAIATSSLTDGDRAMSIVSGKLYIHEFDSSATDAESSPDYIQPNDFTTAGVWVNITTPLDTPEVPVGTVLAWATSSVPTGYFECNGDSKVVADEADLYAVIGYTYGGSGLNFTLPNYKGNFLRGWDHGAGVDDDAATRTTRGDVAATTGDNVGTRQDHAFETHTHLINYKASAYVAGGNLTGGSSSATDQTDPSGAPTGTISATETRPINVNVMWIIKY